MEQRFDGFEIAVFEGRFRGNFEIPHEVGAGMAIFGDEEYTFQVTVVPRNASFGETKTGDPKRTNVLEVVAVEYTGHSHPVVATVPTVVESNGSAAPVEEEEDFGPAEADQGGEGFDPVSEPDFGVDTLAGQQELPVEPEPIPVETTDGGGITSPRT